MVIAQLFNKPFHIVKKRLKRLRKLGISHVLVSPPQKSHASHRWWGRYQPVDFTRIEGPLGDAHSLYELCSDAKDLGMTIVADTVIHHLSNEKRYVRIRGNRIVAAQYPRFSINDLVGLHRLGRGRGLPVLDTHSRWVRSELKNYLRFLHDLGIGGYRFDSAKHIDPQLFTHVLEGLPRGMNFGELVFQHPADYPSSYWRSMKAYDFPLALAISRAFSYHGDLGSLVNCESLWGPLAVTFVNHHDLARNRRGFANFRLHDLVDRRLAYAYLLSRRDGTPLVYGPDLRYREVKAGLRFHQYCRGLGSHPVAASPTTLAVKRGETALAAINKAGYAQLVKTSMEPGLYRDLVMGWEGWTDRGKLHWTMPPRSATLLVKVE